MLGTLNAISLCAAGEEVENSLEEDCLPLLEITDALLRNTVLDVDAIGDAILMLL